MSSYRDILRSTLTVGGGQVAVIAIGIGRTKALALLLGPAGIGLVGLYGTGIGVLSTIAQMGLSTSGARRVAEAVGADDAAAVVRVHRTIGRLSWRLGLAGALAAVVLSWPLARLTFGDGWSSTHVFGFSLLSLLVLIQALSSAQGALLQGLRRINTLTAVQVVGTLVGSVLGVGLIASFGEIAVPAFLVVIGLATWVLGIVALRRLPLPREVEISRAQFDVERRELLKTGAALVVGGVATAISPWLVRIVIQAQFGVDAVGWYQASWTLSVVYIGFVLQAMGTDYFPRLAACGRDDARTNRMISEQLEVGTLLGMPGVIALLALAPWVLRTFYSAEFTPAAEIMRWQILAMSMRIINWPLGFVLLARNLRRRWVICEWLCEGIHLGLVWWCMQIFGLPGAGMALVGSNLVYAILLRGIVRSETGFRWRWRTGLIVGGGIAAIALAWIATNDDWYGERFWASTVAGSM